MASRQGYSSQRQFVVKVAGIDGNFATKQGGDSSADSSKVWDGGSLDPDILTGPADISNITVARPYKTTRDAPLLAKLRKLCGRWDTTITSTPTNDDLVAIASPTTYDVRLVGVRDPEVDAGGSDAATLELEFAVSRVL